MATLLRIWTISANTVREAIRDKLLYSLLFFAVGVIGAAVLIGSLSYVEGERIIQDVGLASIRLFSVGIAVFVGIGLIHGEVERRTIYTILSKPVTRAEFLVGKYFGLLCTVWLQLLCMIAAFLVVSLSTGAKIDGGHAAALLLIAMELMVIVAVATFFSAFTTPMLAAFFTLGIYGVGHVSRDMLALGQQADQPLITWMAAWLYRVAPDLESFNLTIQAVHGLEIAPGEILWPMLYGVGYTAILLLAASYVFQNRDLK
jgi:ABC-type transport system involved in multi-copper enzyme maturation permease subunit